MGRIRVEWRYGALYGVKLLKGKGTRSPGRRLAPGTYASLTKNGCSPLLVFRDGFALGEPEFADESIARANNFPHDGLVLCGSKLSPGQILLAGGGYGTPVGVPDTNRRLSEPAKRLPSFARLDNRGRLAHICFTR